jgi:hypothetical protein
MFTFLFSFTKFWQASNIKPYLLIINIFDISEDKK